MTPAGKCLGRALALGFATLLLSCRPPASPQRDDSTQTAGMGEDVNALKGHARKIIENIRVWSVRHAAFLQQALKHAQEANPLDRMERDGPLNLAQEMGTPNALHQYLICNSPMRGFYVYGLLDSPLAAPLVSRFPVINRVPGLRQFAKGVKDNNFSVLGFMGLDIEYGFNMGMMLGMEVVKVPGLDLYLGNGVDFVWGDEKVYHEIYVGSLPVPIPNTPIVLDAELYTMTDDDEAGILLNYELPSPPKLAGVTPGVGMFLAFSRSKIAQIADLDRWTGKKSTDCGAGEEREAPAATQAQKPAFDGAAFPTPELQATCKAQLSRGTSAGNQRCHTGAIVNSSADVLACLKNGGGRACLTGENRCGNASGGAFTCNVENAIDCLCSNGGMACFKDGYTLNNASSGERRVCWKG